MSSQIRVRVAEADFSIDELIQFVHQGRGAVGAVVTFTGWVRDFNEEGQLQAMVLEHYPGMTEKALHKIAMEASQRWALNGIAIVHRVGALNPTDQIVGIATASAHRADAFDAARFIMDYLKTSAPFWKKEITSDGESWVQARDADDAARAAWDPSSG
jgi:molybdopterin synthase catalytic subunit